MQEEDKLSRLLAQKQTAEDIAEMLPYHDSWMNILNGLWMDNITESNRLIAEGNVQVDIFEKLGRDGRRLKALATESLANAYARISEKRLAIERAIETLGRAVAIADATSKYRVNLSNFLLEELRVHRDSFQADPQQANTRLWAVIEGVQP